jgi:hypothetical protein
LYRKIGTYFAEHHLYNSNSVVQIALRVLRLRLHVNTPTQLLQFVVETALLAQRVVNLRADVILV